MLSFVRAENYAKDHAYTKAPTIQGEAGVVVPTQGYLAKAHEICKKYNVLLIAVRYALHGCLHLQEFSNS